MKTYKRLFMYISILLLLGAALTYIAHTLGLHKNLPHMVYTHWCQYALESLFYSIAFFILSLLLKNNAEDDNDDDI